MGISRHKELLAEMLQTASQGSRFNMAEEQAVYSAQSIGMKTAATG